MLQVEERGELGASVVAAAQRGVAHRVQLAGVGIGRGAVAHRLTTGALHRVFGSVLAVGHPRLAPLALEIAALLQAGDDCVLSHGTAAALWGIGPPSENVVELTSIRRHVRDAPGMLVHRVATLDLRDVRLRHGLPVTAPARTLIDFAAAASGSAVADALNEARVLRLASDAAIEQALERAPLRTGAARLRTVLAAEAEGVGTTRSEAERRLRRLIRHADLVTPRFNVHVQGFLVDAHWASHRVVLEVDGYAVHGRHTNFDGDRRRDQVLAGHGYLVLRVSWRQLECEPTAVVGRVAAALALRSA